MQNIIGSAFLKAGSLPLILIATLTLLVGCDDPGSVGSGLTDSGAEVQIVKDTVAITSTRQFNSFSGNYPFISAGKFNDPLFGEITATGYLKPSLPTTDSLFVDDSVMKVRLLFDTSNVYGDTLANQSFDIFPITKFWRANAQRLKDELELNSNQQVASFTVGEADSLEVTLDAQWVNEHYRPYADANNADSLYENQEFGLALVPLNSGKVVPFDMRTTQFVIETPEDTAVISTDRWAYQMNRQVHSAPPSGTVAVHNMLEQIVSFNLDLEDIDVDGSNISRAELIFYKDSEAMNQSLTGTEQRPQSTAAQLHFVDPDLSPDNLLPGNPVGAGSYSDTDDAFHFEITRFLQNGFINGLDEEKVFYITLPNNGLAQSSLLYVDPESMHPPELVITYLKNISN